MAKEIKYWVVRSSGIHNRGMFALEDIPKATRIIEYVGEKITKKESEKRCLEWEKKARKRGAGLVYIFDLDKHFDLDGNVPGNPAKYINHSCEENCEAIDEDGRIYIYSKRKIKKGDELSFDYGYELEHFMDHPCLCGSEKCVGYIVEKSKRTKLKKMLKGKKKAAATPKKEAASKTVSKKKKKKKKTKA